MKKEQNCASIDFSKVLYDLGIRWKASAYWRFIPGENKHVLVEKLAPFQRGFAAYNVTELGHLIPFGFFNEMRLHKYLNGFFKIEMENEWRTFTSEADARAWYLTELIKSGKVKVEDTKKPDEPVQVSKKHPIPTKK
jgi:hypothetical protein